MVSHCALLGTLNPTGLADGLSLNSWHFLLFAGLSIALVRLWGKAPGRAVLLLLFNIYFLSHFLAGAWSLTVLTGLLLTTYVGGELKVRYPGRWSTGFVVLTLSLWAFLFLVKDPNLLGVANPFHFVPVHIVGVSYLVFRCIQYVMDVEVFEQRSFLTFLNFMLFFPTLLAGPIERFEEYQKQQDEPESGTDVLGALHRIANGFIKKCVIGDNLMVFAIFASKDWETLSWPLLWLGVLTPLLVIYFDFSGYCDIVLGIANLMGFRLIENFDKPLLARNIQEFWNRWHISLSQFIRDYVFNPCHHWIVFHVTPRLQFVAVVVLYFFTMVLIGLWHNTTWGFFWAGIAQGLLLVLVQVSRKAFQVAPGFRRWWDQALIVQWNLRFVNYVLISGTVLLWFLGPMATGKVLTVLFGI